MKQSFWRRNRYLIMGAMEGAIASTVWHYWNFSLLHLLVGWAIMVAIVAPVAWMLDRFSRRVR